MSRPEHPRRILIVRPSALGDVARTVPALVSLKRAYPAAQIDWVVNDAFVEVIAAHPDLHEAVPFPRRLFRGLYKPSVMRRAWTYGRGLRDRHYDAVYDLQGLMRSGMLTWSTRAPHRVGAASAREAAWLGYSRRISVDPAATHTVDQMLAILAGDGVPIVRDMRLYVAQRDRQWAQQWLEQRGLVPGEYTVLAPTARWLSKRWPVESFAALSQRLPELGLRGVVVVGSPGEEPQTAPLAPTIASLGGGDLAGKTTVGQLMAVLEQCGLLIANDSAALHIAIGLGRRCVALFGPTDPAKVGPYRYDLGVLAAPPQQRRHYRDVEDQSVIAALSVEAAFAVAQRVMSSPPPAVIHPD